MIIDVHTHLPYHRIFPNTFMDNVARPLSQNDPRKIEFVKKIIRANLNDDHGENLLLQMDSCGISRSVLLIADFGHAMGEAELSLEEIYSLHREILKKHADRFVVFGGVDPRRGRSAIDLFERSITQFGFSGLKLYPPCGFELDDPILYPLYEICDQHDIPVLTHTGPSFPSLTTERKYPGSILKICEEFRNVNFILGHGGAKAWRANVNLAQRKKNIFLEVSTFQTNIIKPEELASRFRYFFDRIPDQILFGSDWPMFMMGSTFQQIIDAITSLKALKIDESEKLFYTNAKDLLKL
jgi:predicted TIM-barrel fold metal-dependent hydrolase